MRAIPLSKDSLDEESAFVLDVPGITAFDMRQPGDVGDGAAEGWGRGVIAEVFQWYSLKSPLRAKANALLVAQSCRASECSK